MKLTREGWIIFFFGVLALSAYLRIYTPLTLLTAIVFIMIPTISIVWTLLASRGIRFARRLPVEGVAGEEIFATYQLVNYSIFPAFSVRVEDRAIRGYVAEKDYPSGEDIIPSRIYRPESPLSRFWKALLHVTGFGGSDDKRDFEEAYYKTDIKADFPAQFPPLWKGQWQEKSVSVKFMVRGSYLIGPAIVTIKDPLGLFSYTTAIQGFSVILILPKWSTLKRFPIGGSSRILRDENISRDREGWSPEFLGVREYHEGDPLRAVHWKLTARHEQLMVKQFVQQVESSWGVLVDMRKGTNAGKGAETSLEYMVSITAAILEEFDNEKVPHVLVLAGEELTIRECMRGERIFDDVLRVLASCRNDGAMMLNERASELVASYPQVSWVLVTSRKDDDIVNTARTLASYGGTVLVTHIDINSFLVSDKSEFKGKYGRDKMEETLKKWRRMWGEDMEHFEDIIGMLGVTYYLVRKSDNLSMIYLG